MPQKIALGALFGALLTLALVPFTRTYIFAGFAPWGPDYSLVNPPKLTSDPDLAESAVWVETWAQKVVNRTPVSPEDIGKVITVTRRAAEAEPENAYWWQSLAALESSRGRDDLAKVAWHEGAKKSLWKDYQHDRLMANRARLDPEGHGWSHAAAYDIQNYAVMERIKSYARLVIRNASLETNEGLSARMDTLRNGTLIRNYATLIQLGQYGVQLIEMSAYPSKVQMIRNPSKLVLGRMSFHDLLKNGGRDIDAADADATFRDNDGWTAFADTDQALENATSLKFALALATCFPGGMLWAALFGLGIWRLGEWTANSDRASNLWRYPWCLAIGILMALAVGLLTKSPLSGISVLGAFCLLAWKPPRVRYSGDLALGPLYGFLVLCFGILITVGVTWVAMGVSRAGWTLADRLPIPSEYFGVSNLGVGLLAIGLGIAIVLGPAYAWAYRIDPARIVSRTMVLIGRRMALMCLVFSVLSAPLVLYADKTLGGEMRKIVANEPLYYLQR